MSEGWIQNLDIVILVLFESLYVQWLWRYTTNVLLCTQSLTGGTIAVYFYFKILKPSLEQSNQSLLIIGNADITHREMCMCLLDCIDSSHYIPSNTLVPHQTPRTQAAKVSTRISGKSVWLSSKRPAGMLLQPQLYMGQWLLLCLVLTNSVFDNTEK